MAFATINTSALFIPAIEEAFAAEPALKQRVYDATAATPQYQSLFEDIARYTSSLRARDASSTLQTTVTLPEGPAAKKRKIQNGDASGNGQRSVDLKADTSLQIYMQDVSFSIPQRKKLTLELTHEPCYLRARNQNTKDIEFGIPMDQIQHVLCLPVPEKTQRQVNFCIIPRNGDGINTPAAGESAPEAMVWTVNDGPPKSAYSGSGQPLAGQDGETAEKLIRRILNDNLTHTRVIGPDEREFVSAVPEAHRKGEKAFHVKAFRGSKEGYLFFLSTGIFFGFKKPLMFFAFENIESTSYTSVLQRTFNLNIATRANASDEIQEFELSMIDQADFAGIDGYIKGHGLQDASLAEARRAKRYNVNGGKAEKGGEVNAEGEMEMEGESELQKAQRELEDQEDEEEEDYDPGSDDDTDGSGSSSEGEGDSQGEDDEVNEEDDDQDGGAE